MRQPANRKASVNYESKTFPIVAPIGGWNAISSVANMPQTDAYFMDNCWPTPIQVEVRKGWAEHATVPVGSPTPNEIKSMLSYSPSSGSAKLFACIDSGFYDISTPGAKTIVATSCTNGEWRGVNISTAGGNFLWCCNGVDESKVYNGTTWTNLDAVSSPALTGIVSTNVINVCLFKSRLYLINKNSLSFYYLGINSIAGAATEYPLGALFRKGGFLMSCDTWSLDAGNGIDDYIIFWTSEGEVAVFSGVNPADANDWSLVGVYNVGAPLSYNSTVKVGGELLLLTKQGVYPLEKALRLSSVDQSVAISYKIQQAMDFYIKNGIAYSGWQIVFHPAHTMLLVNVPYKVDAALEFYYSYQFVMNTTHNAWARFNNMASRCWVSHNGELYFALNNRIRKALTGNLDGNQPVEGRVKQAYNTLKSTGTNKHVKLVKPIIQSNGKIGLSMALDVDFSADQALQLQNDIEAALSLWDVDKFDETLWTGDLISTDWQSIDNDVGMWFSLSLKILSKDADVSWIATQYVVENGGIL